MTEHNPLPRPEAVETAAEWLRMQGTRYAPEALRERLRAQGYTDAEVAAAEARAAPPPEEPARRDLRLPAAVIVIAVFVGTWALIAIPLLNVSKDGMSSSFAGTAAGILAFLLGIVGLPTLIIIADSDRLRRGTVGALVVVLTIPFLLLVVVGGLCVATTRGLVA
jgi:hypothetical protein